MSDLEADLFQLAMSEKAQPLMDAVKKHIAENVVPITDEFIALHAEKEDRWSWHPRQLNFWTAPRPRLKNPAYGIFSYQTLIRVRDSIIWTMLTSRQNWENTLWPQKASTAAHLTPATWKYWNA